MAFGEEALFQYGALGVLCSLLLGIIIWQQKTDDNMKDRLSEVINNNTIAMTKFYEMTKKCKR